LSNLGSVTWVFYPAATECFIEVNSRLPVREGDLCQLVFGCEERLLRLEYCQKIAHALAELELRDFKCPLSSVDLPP